MSEQIIVADDWTKNWQASIAVKITALVLWVMIFVVFVASTLYLQDLEQRLDLEYNAKADQVAYQIASHLDGESRYDGLSGFLEELSAEYGMSGIQIISGDQIYSYGVTDADQVAMQRSAPHPVAENGVLTMMFYHADFGATVRGQRNQIVITAFIMLLVFGLFLTWAIRTIVHRPLQHLVNATKAVSEGHRDVRLDVGREDEFGYLSRFFNQMLDRLMDQQGELQRSAQAAQAASKAKSAFLANMSHELRTPLNAIIGYSEMLQEDAQTLGVSKCVPDLMKIHSAGRHLLSLINDVLDLSKIEAGKVSLELSEFPVVELVEAAVHSVQPSLDRNNNKLTVQVTPGVDGMYSDETKLRQILVNLLSNAAKFTRNGNVRLLVERYTIRDEDWLKFLVEDTGIGIPEDQLGRLFIDFSQVDSSTTRRYGGTGLGLAISRRYCLRLGGDISVDSAEGRGSVFTVRVPVTCPTSTMIEQSAVNEAVSAAG